MSARTKRRDRRSRSPLRRCPGCPPPRWRWTPGRGDRRRRGSRGSAARPGGSSARRSPSICSSVPGPTAIGTRAETRGCEAALRASSSTTKGLPSDSRAIASAVASAESPLEPSHESASARASASSRAPTTSSRASTPWGERARNSRRKGLLPSSSSRQAIASSRGGAFGGRMSSSSSAALSVSPHWASSTSSTSGRRAASFARSSRSARNARRRTRCGSVISSSARASMPGTRRSTGKRRATAQVSSGRRSTRTSSGKPIRWRLKASIKPSTALYGTATRSYVRPRSTTASPPSARSSRNRWTSADLPIPARPATRTVTRCPERAASNASRSARVCISRPTSGVTIGAAGAGMPPEAEVFEGTLMIPPRRRRMAGSCRAHRGLVLEQRTAKRVEVGRNVLYALARWPRLDGALQRKHLHGGSDERWTPDERLVEHHPDAVPVTGWGRLLERLLRGHVRAVPTASCSSRTRVDGAGHFRRYAEVEQHDTPLFRDEDVGWLDVPVELAGGV